MSDRPVSAGFCDEPSASLHISDSQTDPFRYSEGLWRPVPLGGTGPTGEPARGLSSSVAYPVTLQQDRERFKKMPALK